MARDARSIKDNDPQVLGDVSFPPPRRSICNAPRNVRKAPSRQSPISDNCARIKGGAITMSSPPSGVGAGAISIRLELGEAAQDVSIKRPCGPRDRAARL